MEDFDEDDRSVELLAIAAIYPEITTDPSFPFRASLDIPVVPSSPLQVSFQSQPEAALPAVLTPPTSLDASDAGLGLPTKERFDPSAINVAKEIHTLSYLPPLTLEIDLPRGYPSEMPPKFRISTNPPWLSQSRIAQLIDDGHQLWKDCDRNPVIYTYIDHLQQLAETAFGIGDIPDGEVLLSRDLKIALLDFNNKAEREKFEHETFECGVCLEPKKGVNCHRMLLCSHVFCIPCLQDFYNTCITEGDVENVRCMAPDCSKGSQVQAPAVLDLGDATAKKRKKHDRTLSPSELLQIPLEQETVQRYVFLKRKKKLEADKTTVYCPRQWCQGAARSKRHPKPIDPMGDDFDLSDDEETGFVFDPLGDESQLPPMADRVAICEECNYAFCCVCKKGWHGELVRCFPRRQEELSEEEKATEEYLKLYTSACPTCNAPCQKRMGCNHMKCFKCDTHFCYLCSAWLAEGNPYRHFNDPESICYNRLWDLEGGDGLNPDGAEALHQIPDALLEFDEEDDDISEDDNDSIDHDDDFSENADDNPVWEFDDSDDDIERRQPPPPAPFPPRINGAARGARHHAPDAAGRAAAAERQAQAQAMAEVRRGRLDAVQPVQHPIQRPVRNRAAQQPQPRAPPVMRPGLQRFLDLVQNDREDEWDRRSKNVP
ncbi:hypothetical protein ASPZODRAFT_876718 [Penicilliopsis zonata CBS 506.65]|uniref:RBR-type E3 ubiquitin transferase n=1 Tax=Penicilliopsis zonata CBS 506.65 TaxID=1073090 RepID=A0A1L9S9K4_9EURO|nr:hypothetical protein ASPZODRAFT_876718 [Penicilliopsis zonata CBS 506.65]OJJ43833.1 hypothetical protein ASPZODRAFT_876718 [Penicilliopsis zonata CBS 506.65]